MEKTIKITNYINKKGIDTRLDIIGSKNNKKTYPKYINQIGFINKNIKKDHIKLKNILSKSDFHILMTKRSLWGSFCRSKCMWDF